MAGRGKELPCGSGILKAAEIDKFQIEQRASEAPTNVCACDRRVCSEDNTVPNKRSIGRIRSSACLSRVCVSFERGGGHEEMEQPCGRFFNRVMAQGRGRIRPRGHRALPTESVGRVQVMFSAATGWDSTFLTTRKKRGDIKLK